MKPTEFFMIILTVGLIAFGIFIMPWMPEQMASHWNMAGEVDGYISRDWGVLLLPLLLLVVTLMFLLIPRIDPLKKNIEMFRKYFDGLIWLFIIFFIYLYGLTIVWNLGWQFEMVRFLIPAFALLFFYIGWVMPKMKRNWFIGIRTPWTLSSDLVWEKTHKLGGLVFKICAIFIFVGIILPDYAFWLLLIPLLAGSIVLIVYSYWQHRLLDR